MVPFPHSEPNRPCLPSPPLSPQAASGLESNLARTKNAQTEPSQLHLGMPTLRPAAP